MGGSLWGRAKIYQQDELLRVNTTPAAHFPCQTMRRRIRFKTSARGFYGSQRRAPASRCHPEPGRISDGGEDLLCGGNAMIRRDFFKNSLAMAALAAGTGTAPLSAAPASPAPRPPKPRRSPKRRASPNTSPNSSSTRNTPISPPTCSNWAENRSSTASASRSPGRRP